MKHSTKIWLLQVLWLFLSFNTLAVPKDFSGKNPSPLSSEKFFTWDAMLHVNAPPPPISGDASVCEGEVEVYTYPATPGYVYIWTATSGSGTPSGNTFTVTWGSPGSGSVTLIVKDALGNVVDTQVLPVTIHSKPYPYITASFSPSCERREGEGTPNRKDEECLLACDSSIVVYSTPFNPGSSYTWTVIGANSFTPSANTVTVYWGAPGAGLIRVEETNVFGCTNAYEKCVTIIESPDAFFTSIPAAVGGVITVCNGQTIQFFDASTGSVASPLADWFWDFGDGNTSTDQNPTHTFYNTPSGTYTVTMWVENQCHCKDSFTVTVNVLSDPPPIIECISTVCANGVDHYHTPSGCAGATYNWSVTGGTITSPMPYGPDIDVQWGASGPGIVTLQILGCGGVCPTPASVVVSIISPTTTISGPNPACTNTTSIYSIPNMPGSVYTWTVTGGFIMSGQGTEQVEVYWFGGTTGTISVTYVNPTLHCDGSASMVVNLRPEFAISGQNQVCNGSTHAYTATPGTPAENAAYNWVVTDQTNAVVASFGGSNVYNINWTFGPGIYKITATNNSGAFCNSPQSFFVTVYDAPPPPTFITGKNPVCPNSSAMYTSAPTMSGTFIEWNVINGVPVSASGNQLTVTWGASGPYILEVRQVSMTFPYCPSPPFIDTIDSKLPPPTFAILGPTPVCKNTVQNYAANSSYGDEYTWSISPANMGSVIGGQGTPNVQVQWNNTAGVATLSLSVKTCGVISNVNLPVTLTNPPPPVINGPASICENVGALFSTTTTGTGFTWDFGDGTVVSGAGPHNHVYTSPGTYNVTLTVTNPNGCIGVSSTVFLINVKPAPDAAITTPDPTVYCPPGSPISTTLYMSALLQPGSTVDWYESSLGYVGSGITYTATATGTYWAVVTSVNGCSTTSNVITISYGNCFPCPIDPHFLNFTANKTGCLTYDFFGNISTNGRVLGWNFNDPWNPVGSTALNPSHTFVEPGYYNVIFSGRFPKAGVPGDSCDRDTAMTVVVPIKAKFSYEITCGGASDYIINFLDLSTYVSPYTITNWSWSFPGGTPSTSSLQNPSVSFPAGTTPMVSLTITTTMGPGSPYTCNITLPVNVPTIPNLNIVAPTFTCQGTPVQFTTTPPTGIVNSWHWNFADGATSLLQPTTRTYTAPSAGNHNVVLTITDQFGCPRTFNHNIFVHTNNLTASVSAAGPTTFCDGQSVTLNSVVGGAVLPVSYLWNTVDITPSIVVTQTGGYWYEIQDARTCRTRSNTVDVLVHPVPQGIIVGDDDYCFGETTLLSAYQGASYSYQWLINGSPSVSGPTFSQIQSPGSYNFQVIITNTSNGCKDTSPVYPVIVRPLPPIPGVSAAPTPACEGSAITLTATTGIFPYTFNWSNGDVGNSTVVYNAGLYTVTLTDQYGCQSENSTQVFEMPDFSNLLQGCYEFCDTAPVTLIGPVGIGFTYQWYHNGNPIPGPVGTVKDLVIPVGADGIYQLEITTFAGCTDISGRIEVRFIHCKDCHADWRFRDITCVIDSNGTRVYYFTIDLFNPLGPGATYTLTPTGGISGYITGTSPAALAPGSNLISGFFIDVPPSDNPLCLTATLYYGEERCIMKEICTDLPECKQPEPCHVDAYWLTVVCAGKDANGNPQYYFDYGIHWPGMNGSPILSITTPNGTISNVSIADLNTGFNTLSGLFTSTDGSHHFCFEMYVYDPASQRVCFIKDCIDLPECPDVDDCGRRVIRLKAIDCNGFDINGNQTYKVDFTVSNPFGSNATIYFTSPDGGFSGMAPNNVPPGSSLVNGIFTDLPPAGGTVCVTIIIVEDGSGRTCRQTMCFNLPACDADGFFAGFSNTEKDDDPSTANSILVNPNPAKEQTVITYNISTGTHRLITVTDMYGRAVNTFPVKDAKGTITLQTGSYSPGVYMVTGFSDNKAVGSKRLVIIK